MKKRKFKLFTSIASLALVVAVMAVGVWAATTVAIGVSTNISFTSRNIDGVITVTKKIGSADASNVLIVDVDSATGVGTPSTGSLASGVFAAGPIAFTETNGYIVEDDRKIVFTFEFTSNLGNASKGYMLIQAGFSSASAEAAALANPITTKANISTATGGSENGLITLELSDYDCLAETEVNAGTTITATFTYSGDCTQDLEKVYVYFSVTVSSTAIA